MLKLTQKVYTNKECKHFAFVDCRIVHEGYDYHCTFDEHTKKRTNAWFRSLGFRVGEIQNPAEIPPKEVTI